MRRACLGCDSRNALHCQACLGQGVIEERVPAKDASCDAETFRLNVEALSLQRESHNLIKRLTRTRGEVDGIEDLIVRHASNAASHARHIVPGLR